MARGKRSHLLCLVEHFFVSRDAPRRKRTEHSGGIMFSEDRTAGHLPRLLCPTGVGLFLGYSSPGLGKLSQLQVLWPLGARETVLKSQSKQDSCLCSLAVSSEFPRTPKMNSAGLRRIYTLAHNHQYSQVLNYGKQSEDSFMSSLLSSNSCEIGIEYLLGPFEVVCRFLAN